RCGGANPPGRRGAGGGGPPGRRGAAHARDGRMRAVRRRLINVLAVLSLLLCLAASAMWVRSYYGSDALEWCRVADWPDHLDQKSARLASAGGEIAFQWTRGSYSGCFSDFSENYRGFGAVRRYHDPDP